MQGRHAQRTQFARTPGNFEGLWLSGLCWSVMFTAFMLAMTLTTVANVLVTMSTGPLLTALGARVFLRHRIPMRTWAAIWVAGGAIAWIYGSQMGQVDMAGWIGIAVAFAVPVAGATNWTLNQRAHARGEDVDLVLELPRALRNRPEDLLALQLRSDHDDIIRAGEALAPAKRRRIHTFSSGSDIHLEKMMRMTRAALINLLASPYMEMARLKGVSQRDAIIQHALPNAWAPIATVIAFNLAYLVVGVVVVEVVFVYPGIGQLMVDSVSSRNMPVVQACALIFAATYILLNLSADIVSIITNPRLLHPK